MVVLKKSLSVCAVNLADTSFLLHSTASQEKKQNSYIIHSRPHTQKQLKAAGIAKECTGTAQQHCRTFPNITVAHSHTSSEFLHFWITSPKPPFSHELPHTVSKHFSLILIKNP